MQLAFLHKKSVWSGILRDYGTIRFHPTSQRRDLGSYQEASAGFNVSSVPLAEPLYDGRRLCWASITVKLLGRRSHRKSAERGARLRQVREHTPVQPNDTRPPALARPELAYVWEVVGGVTYGTKRAVTNSAARQWTSIPVSENVVPCEYYAAS